MQLSPQTNFAWIFAPQLGGQGLNGMTAASGHSRIHDLR